MPVDSARTEPLAGSRKRMLFSDLAISIWLCGAGVLLLRLLVCQAGLCLLKSRSRQVADTDLLDQLEFLSRSENNSIDRNTAGYKTAPNVVIEGVSPLP